MSKKQDPYNVRYLLELWHDAGTIRPEQYEQFIKYYEKMIEDKKERSH